MVQASYSGLQAGLILTRITSASPAANCNTYHSQLLSEQTPILSLGYRSNSCLRAIASLTASQVIYLYVNRLFCYKQYKAGESGYFSAILNSCSPVETVIGVLKGSPTTCESFKVEKLGFNPQFSNAFSLKDRSSILCNLIFNQVQPAFKKRDRVLK